MKYLPTMYYVLGPVLGAKDKAVNKAASEQGSQGPHPMELIIQEEDMLQLITGIILWLLCCWVALQGCRGFWGVREGKSREPLSLE